MKCIRAFSCSCLNDTMAAFRCFSTGWCCKMLCFQCWFRRFLENTTVKPTTVYLQRWHSQRAGKKDLPKYNHIRIDVVREKDIYIYTHIYVYQLNMTCLIKSKSMPWDKYLSNYLDLSVVLFYLHSFIFLLQKEAQLSSSCHNGKSNFTFKSAMWKFQASSFLSMFLREHIMKHCTHEKQQGQKLSWLHLTNYVKHGSWGYALCGLKMHWNDLSWVTDGIVCVCWPVSGEHPASPPCMHITGDCASVKSTMQDR